MSGVSYVLVALLLIEQPTAAACPEPPGLAQSSLNPHTLPIVSMLGGDAAVKLEAIMAENHVEAILLWSGAGPSPAAERWLSDRSLTVTPMQAGLLVSGGREAFEAAFGVVLVGRNLPVSLPVPGTLGDNVAAISIRRPPGYHQEG